MLSLQVKFVKEGHTDRPTTVKQYAHDLSMLGLKSLGDYDKE